MPRRFPVPIIGGGGPPSLPIMSWRDLVAAAENPYFPPHHVSPFPDPSPIEVWLQETTPTLDSADASRSLPILQPFEGMLDTGGLYPCALVQVRWDVSQAALASGSISLVLQTASIPQDMYFTDVGTLATIDTSHSVSAGEVTSAWLGLGTSTRLARYVRWALVENSSPSAWTLRFSILLHLKPRV